MGLVWYWKIQRYIPLDELVCRLHTKHTSCPYFMLSQDAISFHFLQQKVKRHAGKHAESIMNSQLLLNCFHFALRKMVSQISFT